MLTRQLRRCLQRGWSYARPVTGFWRAWGRRQKQDLLTLAGLAGGALGAHRRRRSRAHARTLVAAWLQRALEPLEPRMLMLTLTWDGGTGGTWNASNHNWIEQGQSGDVAWIVGADALFPSAATVNVSGSVTANNVSFTGTGQYTINAVANTSAHVYTRGGQRCHRRYRHDQCAGFRHLREARFRDAGPHRLLVCRC